MGFKLVIKGLDRLSKAIEKQSQQSPALAWTLARAFA